MHLFVFSLQAMVLRTVYSLSGKISVFTQMFHQRFLCLPKCFIRDFCVDFCV